MRSSLTLAGVVALLSGCPAPGVVGGSSTGANGASGAASASSTGKASTTGSSGQKGGSGSSSGGSSGGVADAGSLLAFPPTSIIYQDISNSPLNPNSALYIGTVADGGGWGTPNSYNAFQIDQGLTVLFADPSVPLRTFTPNAGYATPDCDMTMVPLPPGGAAEGTADYNCDSADNDCHVLIFWHTRLFELWKGNVPNGLYDGDPFTASCEVAWDLTHDYWQPGVTPYSRGDQCTSADAAGMPIAPLLPTAAEIQAGVVNHALRFTLPNPEIQAGVYVHPGTHAGGPSGGPGMPPYASRFRLRGDFDGSSFTPAAQVLIAALQKYGMFLDDGGDIPLTIDSSTVGLIGSHDLFGIQVTDFEVVPSPDPIVPLTDTCTRTQLTE